MGYSFKIKRLRHVREEIEKRHKLAEDFISSGISDELNDILYAIQEAMPDELEKLSRTYSVKEIKMLASYVPFNSLKIELDNVVAILKYRSSENAWKSLYIAWQNSYNNKESNKYIDVLLASDKCFQDVLEGYSLSSYTFSEIINANNIPGELGHYIANGDMEVFKKECGKYGISKNLKLYKDYIRLFYTFCNKDSYLVLSLQELDAIIRKYNDEELKLFLNNFLSKMPFKEIENRYLELASYLKEKTGDLNTIKFNSFFADFDPEVIKKYKEWLTLYKIKTSFYSGDTEERWDFWKRYKYEYVDDSLIETKDAIILYGEEYVVREFIYKASGAAYIFKRDVFEQKVRKEYKLKNKNDLKSKLYNDFLANNGNGLSVKRLEHRGDWQGDFARYVRQNNKLELR